MSASRHRQLRAQRSDAASPLALALVSTVLGLSAYLAGLRRLGAAPAAVLSTFEPVVTALAGAAFLADGDVVRVVRR